MLINTREYIPNAIKYSGFDAVFIKADVIQYVNTYPTQNTGQAVLRPHRIKFPLAIHRKLCKDGNRQGRKQRQHPGIQSRRRHGWLSGKSGHGRCIGSELTLGECIHRGALRGGASETGRSPWLGGAETAVEIAGISGCRRGRTVASPHFSEQMIPQNFSAHCNMKWQ